MPSIAWGAAPALVPTIAAPFAANARLAPTSPSSVAASTKRSGSPNAEIRKVAVSEAAFASAAAANVTACHVLPFAALNVRVAPLCTTMFASPATRATVTVMGVAGACTQRRNRRPSPFSRTSTRAALAASVPARMDCVATGAGFQLALPACVAATTTVPGPPNASRLPSRSVPGPETTVNSTGKPLEAVASSAITSVASAGATAGNAMAWSTLAIVRRPLAAPCQLASATCADTA